MRIEIIGRKYDVSAHLEDVIRHKIDKQLGHYFSDDDTARVVCKEEHGKCKMELTIVVGGTTLRAEETSDNMYNNVDVVVPKVERQMRKYRTKLSKNLREKIEVPETAPQEEMPTLVRTKHYKLQSMSVDDALFQMEMLDNDFYMFLNSETGLVSLVYKRKDGNVGMIEGEF